MDINNIELPEGINKKQFRDIARQISHREFSLISLENVFNENKVSWSNKYFDYLIDNKYIEEKNDDYGHRFESTLAFRAIGCASLTKRKTKEKSWEDVAKLIIRAEVMKETSLEWSTKVAKNIYLFGSMLDSNKKDYGDADLAVSFNNRSDIELPAQRVLQSKWLKNKDCASSAAFFMNMFDARQQITIDLKNSNSFFSIHTTSDPIELSDEDIYKTKEFPIIKLWTSKNESQLEEDEQLNKLTNNWKLAHPIEYKNAFDNLNESLLKLGVGNINSPSFNDDCKKYQKLEFAREIQNMFVKNMSEDQSRKIINKAKRFGSLGDESLGMAIRMQGYELSCVKYSNTKEDKISKKNIEKGFQYMDDKMNTIISKNKM